MNAKYASIINRAALAAAGAGVPGTFVLAVDAGAVAGIWTTMMLNIADASGHAMDRRYAAKTMAAVIAGIGGYYAGWRLLSASLLALPGAGTGGAVTLNSAINYWYTRRLGKALGAMFDRPHLELGDAALVGRELVGFVRSRD